jgi:hypothetical protein
MKTFALVMVLITLASGLYAERLRRPAIEMSVRGSLYIDYLSDGTDFGLGADITFNPSRILGLRVRLAELYFDGGTTFTLNQGYISLMVRSMITMMRPRYFIDCLLAWTLA